MNIFCNFENAPVNKVSLMFSSQNHTPHCLLPMLQWLILNCNQTLHVNCLAYWSNLVSQVRLDENMKLLKVFPFDKRSLLMKSFPFLMTGITKLCTQTQLHSPQPSSFQPSPSSIHLYWYHFSLHPALWNTLNIWTKILHVIGQFPIM